MAISLRSLNAMKNKKWVLVLLVLVVVLGVNGYNHFYRTKTVILDETMHYEYKVPARAFLIFNEQVIAAGENFTPDPAVLNQRLKGDTVIGTVDDTSAGLDQGVPIDVESSFESAANENKLPRWVSHYAETIQGQESFPTMEEPRPWLIKSEGVVTTNVGGVLIDGTDGFEGITPRNVEQLSLDQMWALTHMQETTLQKGQYKLVDNLDYSMIITTEGEVSNSQTVDIAINHLRIQGDVLSFDQEENKTYYRVNFQDQYERVYNKRAMEISIIEREFNAFAVPKSAVFENDNTTGVMMKGDDALVTFVPITDYFIEDDTAYIRVLAGEVQYYDELFLHPKAVEEGDFIE